MPAEVNNESAEGGTNNGGLREKGFGWRVGLFAKMERKGFFYFINYLMKMGWREIKNKGDEGISDLAKF